MYQNKTHLQLPPQDHSIQSPSLHASKSLIYTSAVSFIQCMHKQASMRSNVFADIKNIKRESGWKRKQREWKYCTREWYGWYKGKRTCWCVRLCIWKNRMVNGPFIEHVVHFLYDWPILPPSPSHRRACHVNQQHLQIQVHSIIVVHPLLAK